MSRFSHGFLKKRSDLFSLARLDSPNQLEIAGEFRLPARGIGRGSVWHNAALPAPHGEERASASPDDASHRRENHEAPIPMRPILRDAAREARLLKMRAVGVAHPMFSCHCEPTGRANARPMTGSAKQSIYPLAALWIASAFALRRFGGLKPCEACGASVEGSPLRSSQ